MWFFTIQHTLHVCISRRSILMIHTFLFTSSSFPCFNFIFYYTYAYIEICATRLTRRNQSYLSSLWAQKLYRPQIVFIFAATFIVHKSSSFLQQFAIILYHYISDTKIPQVSKGLVLSRVRLSYKIADAGLYACRRAN